jgi:hypothetical protein
MLTNIRFYRVKGGSGDGKTLNVRYLPPLNDGDKVWVKEANTPHGEQYQLRGDTLCYVQRDDIRYVGGPCDGCLCQEDEVVPIGENAVVPLGDGRYAWYLRRGDKMYFDGFSTFEELELIQAENG